MALERSSDDSLSASFFVFFLFCPIHVGHGIQVNERCMQSENNLICLCILVSSS
jgi:hypothetical protein